MCRSCRCGLVAGRPNAARAPPPLWQTAVYFLIAPARRQLNCRSVFDFVYRVGLPMRILLLLLAVGALFAVPALLFEGWIDAERVLSLFQSQSPWVAMFGIAAICADLFIPFPAQAIMTLFGENYGWFIGGLLATAGTFCAGLLAFELCRLMGQKMVVIIAGKRGLARFQVFFLRYGFWAIVVSRWLPAAAEALASLAGATRM